MNWIYSENNYIDDDGEDEDDITMDEYLSSKRKGPNIKIRKI